MRLKIRVGEELNSDPIIADAHCTRACIYMSVVLLVSSLLFTLTKIPYLDSLGALGIAYYSFKEGREAWEKANGKEACESC
jgi:divalent metal cation (Fe/Co/Zn/Cd) transporter